MKIGNEKPVNITAARMLWRAPWWAKVDEPAQKAVRENPPVKTLQELVNLTSPPPEGCNDLRGHRRGEFLIIGHAESIQHQVMHKTHKPNYWVGDGWVTRKTKQWERRHWWWCIDLRTGEIVMKNNKKLNKHRNKVLLDKSE
jgi:hypothetical protein